MYARPLSYASAKSCEEAQEPECRCRCQGLLHGVKRGDVTDLPLGDPHSQLIPCKSCKGTGKSMDDPCPNCGGRGLDLTDSAKRGMVRDKLI